MEQFFYPFFKASVILVIQTHAFGILFFQIDYIHKKIWDTVNRKPLLALSSQVH